MKNPILFPISYPTFLVLMMFLFSSIVPPFLNYSFFSDLQAQEPDMNTIKVGVMPLGIEYNPTNDTIYVANSKSSTVSVIHRNDSVIDTIMVGSMSVWLDYVSSTNEIYVTNYQSRDVYVIDCSTNEVVKVISLGRAPFGITHDPSGKFVYVSYLNAQYISVISTATAPTLEQELQRLREEVIKAKEEIGKAIQALNNNDTQGSQEFLNSTMQILNSTLEDQSDPVQNKTITNDKVVTDTAYADNSPVAVRYQTAGEVSGDNQGDDESEPEEEIGSNTGSNNANIGNRTQQLSANASELIHRNIALTSDPEDRHLFIAYSDKNGALYQSGFPSGVVSVINPNPTITENDAVAHVNDIGLGGNPAGIAYNPNNKMLYVGNFASKEVYVIDPATNSLNATIHVNSSPIDFAYNEDNRYMYVTNFGSDAISRINNYKVDGEIQVEKNPFGIIYVKSPNDQKDWRIYVTNPNSDKVTRIDSSNNPDPVPRTSDTTVLVLILIAIVFALIILLTLRRGWLRGIGSWLHLR